MLRRSLASLSWKLVGSGVRCGPSSERCRYQQNWVVLAAYCTLVGFSYSSALPSLHQFVTSSTHPEDPNVQPGLGLSETWYSWIVSIISVGELAGAVATSVLLQRIYTKLLMLGNLSLCVFGGLLYGVGEYGWMLLIGRFLIGYYMGAVTVVLRTYLGETSSTVIAAMPPEKREKSALKNTAFFATFTVCSMSALSGPVSAAIVAQIPAIDQFRWPGYLTIIYSFLLGVVTMVWFREKRGDVQKKGGPVVPKHLPIPLYTLGCLVAAFFVINWYFAVFETLLNPVLADNFGFDVEYDSYAFFGTLAFFSSGLFVLYTLQRLHINNRISSIIALSLALVGSLIATDWQSVQGDPCSQFSKTEGVVLTDVAVGSGSGMEGMWCEVDPGSYLCAAEKSGVNLEECGVEQSVMMDEVSVVNASCVCEAFSGVSEFNCFWNPHSRVTGRDCQRCARLCRSHTHSLNLIQFLVGMSITTSIIAMGRISITLIASDALAGESQALFMGTLVGVGATARFTGPLWANAAYLAADHHVYIVMNILSVSILLVIVPYILLYRTMKPATQQQQQQRTGESVAELQLNLLLNNDTVELASDGYNGEKEFVSLEDGDWCVEKDSGGLGDGEREVKGGKKRKGNECDTVNLLPKNMELYSDDEEEVDRL